MTRQIKVVCGFSGNTEIIVPEDLSEPLPEGIAHNKNASCSITPSPEGEKMAFTVVLPRGDRINIKPSIPYTRFAGSSVNISQIAHALGMAVHTWLTVGTDPYGFGMYQSLDKLGIRVSNIECGVTPITIGIRGEKATTLLMQKPSPPEYTLSKDMIRHIVSGLALCQPDIFFATSVGEIELPCAEAAFQRLERTLCVFCPRISILGECQFEKLLLSTMAAADIVSLNRREYRHLTNNEFASDSEFKSAEHLPWIIERLAKQIEDDRQRFFVVTCDVDGASAVAYAKGNITGIHDVPAITDSSTVDTTGAGDAFALGMALACQQALPWQEAMVWGARLAAENVKGIGGWYAADKENNPQPVTSAFFDIPTV